MFWIEDAQIMFTGDHILFGITPNITSWVGVEDSLEDYLESLQKVKTYPVRLALPGHRQRGDYHARIDALLAHHARRIEEAFQIVQKMPGLTAYDVVSCVTWKIQADHWKHFPPNQKWFAVGKCLSHLDYLRKRGRIARIFDGEIFHYESTGAS